MPKLLSRAVISILLFVANVAVANEYRINIDNDLVAIHNKADSKKSTQTPKAAVLLIHGWASQMNEVGDMYLQLAARLAAKDYASLRINIRGESEGEKNNFKMTSTFASRVADAQAGLNFLLEQYPNTPIAVVGFSLGGATALALTGSNPDKISSVVLWSSAGNPANMLDTMPTEVVQKVMKTGQAILQQWVDLTITRKHLQGMQGHDIFSPLAEYTGALLSIRGSDDYVPVQEPKIFASANASPEESVLISGADHIYHSLSADKQYVERVLTHTIRWFNDTLNEKNCL
ncbi:alpha/beta fold hydrolase [Paraglaciecola aquimarina]|uniref:Alpha/beta fold hydrolase n=1 Tax=Paraglaciecola algarum TaxID=3050085 RepID=A0ABS9D886_9ALTE|nr:alpha/beta fold hydrolase [Paraglaciecola sp. G1-23]MCF2948024.1 alpha/beta fold hydrolase [Paraglaciecola sp. G1-23]